MKEKTALPKSGLNNNMQSRPFYQFSNTTRGVAKRVKEFNREIRAIRLPIRNGKESRLMMRLAQVDKWVLDQSVGHFAPAFFAGYARHSLKGLWNRDKFPPNPASNRIEELAKVESWEVVSKGHPRGAQIALQFRKWKKAAGEVANRFHDTDEVRFFILPHHLAEKYTKAADSPPENEVDISALEGGSKLRLHMKKERQSSLVKRAKEHWLRTEGELRCGICNFSFSEQYRGLGEGFIEVHHRSLVPSTKQKVSIKDLIPVCANCHRMLHRKNGLVDVQIVKMAMSRTSAANKGGL